MITTLTIKYSTTDLATSMKMSEILRNAIPNNSYTSSIEDISKDKPQILSTMTLSVPTDSLILAFETFDKIKGGFIVLDIEILKNLYNDLYLEVDYNLDNIELATCLGYLNKTNFNHTNEINHLYRKINATDLLVSSQQRQIDALIKKLDGLSMYTFGSINLPGLVKVVRDLAEEVDEDLLLNFPLITLH